MIKVPRVERVVALSKILMDMPGYLFSLGHFSNIFGVAKSTLSEDMVTIKRAVERYGLGTVETVSGAAGGLRYVPCHCEERMNTFLTSLAARLSEPERIIPGDFLYMSDILFMPDLMMQVGEIFRTRFAHLSPDYIMTVETKGIPLAFTTARAFGLPLVIVRQGSKVTEGPSVSINYVTGAKRIQTMSLPRRALVSGSKVLVIDDFMKAGGTARGMIDLANEVGATVVGTGVLIATNEPEKKLVDEYSALLMLHDVDQHTRAIDIRPVF